VETTTSAPKSITDLIEEAEEFENNLDDDSTTEITNQTKKRDRRELMQMMQTSRPLELDVVTPQLLIMDQDERNFIYSTQTCISKSLLPLLPISFVTIISLTIVLTISLHKHCFTAQKSLLFY
jgi:hypothetical protein